MASNTTAVIERGLHRQIRVFAAKNGIKIGDATHLLIQSGLRAQSAAKGKKPKESIQKSGG